MPMGNHIKLGVNQRVKLKRGDSKYVDRKDL